MIFRDALRYYEITGCDFQTDLEEFGRLQKNYIAGIVDNSFTDKYESFTDKLLLLWIDKQGGTQSALEKKLELPSDKELLSMFCRVINPSEEEEALTKGVTLDDDLLRRGRKKTKENKVLNLFTSIVTADIDASQFLDFELELVYQALQVIGENKKKEADKAKRRNRKV